MKQKKKTKDKWLCKCQESYRRKQIYCSKSSRFSPNSVTGITVPGFKGLVQMDNLALQE